MRKWILSSLFVAVGLGAFGFSQVSRADDICSFVKGSAAGALITSTTLGPLGTTLVIQCAFDADVDSAMVEREAAMVIEENRVFQPSYLGTYAQQKGYTDIRKAARDVVDAGVQK